MKRTQMTAIENFANDKVVKVIDEGFEGEIIIYAQVKRGDYIMEHSVSPIGTITYRKAYPPTPQQQKFFDGEPHLVAYLLRNS